MTNLAHQRRRCVLTRRSPSADAPFPEDTVKCPDCGGIHYGSVGCPYLREEPCHFCGKTIAYKAERRFDEVGRAYHVDCMEWTGEGEEHALR